MYLLNFNTTLVHVEQDKKKRELPIREHFNTTLVHVEHFVPTKS